MEVKEKKGLQKIKKRHFFIPIGAIFFLLAVFIVAFFIDYSNNFFKTAGLEYKTVFTQAKEGIDNPYQKDYLTILLLGLDQRADDDSLLTDTILLVTVNAKTGNYALFSIPRDLWIPDFKTKINSLYYYGKKQDPNDGSQLVKLTIESILGWKIDHVAVLKMDQIKKLVDLVGGVEIDVERSFTDKLFPADDGTGKVKTVSFEKGLTSMNGQTVLEYMRSRQSTDLIEGTDEARQERQKKVILGLKDKLFSKKFIAQNPQILGAVYNFFTNQVEITPGLDFATIFSYAKIGQKVFTLGVQSEYGFPWKGESPILTDSRDPTYNSWILVPVNNQWELVKNYFQQNLP
jgi:LCP family protein required for cell wall assembly